MDNLGDLVSRIALALQEENLTVTTDGDHWTAAEIIGYINDVQLQFCRLSGHPKQKALVAIRENQFQYNKPTQLLRIEAAWFLGQPMEIFTESYMDSFYFNNETEHITNTYPTPFGRATISNSTPIADSWRFKTGQPKVLIINEASQATFRVYKIPDAQYAYTMATIADSADSVYGVLVNMGVNTNILGVLPNLTYIPRVEAAPDDVFGAGYVLNPLNFLQEDVLLSGTVTTDMGTSTTAVNGTGTKFLTELSVYDTIKVGNDVMVVASIISDTLLNVDTDTPVTENNVGVPVYETAGWKATTLDSPLGFLTSIKFQNVIQLEGPQRPASLTTGTPTTTTLDVDPNWYEGILYGVLERAWGKEGTMHDKGNSHKYKVFFEEEVRRAKDEEERTSGAYYRSQRHPTLTVR